MSQKVILYHVSNVCVGDSLLGKQGVPLLVIRRAGFAAGINLTQPEYKSFVETDSC